MTYGSATLFILLVIVVFQYVSLRNQYTQMKATLDTAKFQQFEALKELQDKLEDELKKEKSCNNNMEEIKKVTDQLNNDVSVKSQSLKDMENMLADTNKALSDTQAEKETLQSSIDALQQEKKAEEDKYKALEVTLNECNEKLKKGNVQADAPNKQSQEQAIDAPKVAPSDDEKVAAQLPDVKVEAVKVKKVGMKGNRYHKDSNGGFMPIIVQGSQMLPRPEAKLSVMNMKQHANRFRRGR